MALNQRSSNRDPRITGEHLIEGTRQEILSFACDDRLNRMIRDSGTRRITLEIKDGD